MSEQAPKHTDNLQEEVQPVMIEVIGELKRLFSKYPLAHESHGSLWKRFFEIAQNDPEKIKIYISKFPLIETEATLKFGIDTDEETGEQGFPLPLTFSQALELLSKISPDNYSLLCRHATKNHISLLQQHIDKNSETGADDHASKVFLRSLQDDLEQLVKLEKTLEEGSPEKDWRESIQLYFVQ